MANSSNEHISQKDDFQAALTAMRRAADQARQRAQATTGVLVAWRDGRIVEERLDDTGAAVTQKSAAPPVSPPTHDRRG